MILYVVELRMTSGEWGPTPDARTSEARARLRMEHLRQRYPSHEYRVRPWVPRGPVAAALGDYLEFVEEGPLDEILDEARMTRLAAAVAAVGLRE